MTTHRQAHRRYIASVTWAAVRAAWWAEVPKGERRCRARSRRCHGALQLHHRSYRRAFRAKPYKALGREWRRDLVPLCDHHHKALHRYQRRTHLTVQQASRRYLALTAAYNRR